MYSTNGWTLPTPFSLYVGLEERKEEEDHR